MSVGSCLRRRSVIGVLVLAAALAVTVSRCDPRAPGTAAPIAAALSLPDGTRRDDVRIPCGDTQCAAWLFRPAGAVRPPVVLMAHGFAGTRDVGLPFFAAHFAHAGMAALVFDYRHFGASGGLPRQLVDPWEQLDDWRAVLAWARGQADLDGSRVALWGSSLGAGHALTIAAGDPHLAAVVAQVPLIDTCLEGEATHYGAAWGVRLLFCAWGDFIGSAYGASPLQIAAIAPAGGFGMIVDDGAHDAVARLTEPGTTYQNAVAARSAFLFDDYNPALHEAEITAPVLLIASPRDRFAPFAAAQEYAAQASNVTLEVIDADHFEVYLPPARAAAADMATAFLIRHLGLQPAP
ncbi:MAG: alpha/beta fold hydrolase [bacterium]